MNERTDDKVIVGVFRDRIKAEEALDELHRAGFSEDDTGYIVRGEKDPGDDNPSPVEDDADLEDSSTGGGVLAGGTVGGILGAAATGLIPGVGPIIAAGALAGILGGAAAGGVAGGVLGTLRGIGIPENEAEIYEEEFNKGYPLITVHSHGREEQVRQILEKHGARDAHSRSSME